MERIIFRPTADTYGMPSPHIPDGSTIILVQDGRAEVGRYEEPHPPEEPSPAFSHPDNTAELAAGALQAVLAAYPETDLHDSSLVFTCPPELAARAVWSQTPSA